MEDKKVYNSKSPEYVKMYNQKYYAKVKANRDQQKDYCNVCCCEISCGGMKRHMLTKKHLSIEKNVVSGL